MCGIQEDAMQSLRDVELPEAASERSIRARSSRRPRRAAARRLRPPPPPSVSAISPRHSSLLPFCLTLAL